MRAAAIVVETDGDGTVALVIGHDHRPDEIVPHHREAQNGQRAQDALGQRHGDLSIALQVGGTVDDGSLEQPLRQRGEKGAQDIDVIGLGTGDVGQDEHPVGVQQAQLVAPHKVGNELQDAGDHHQQHDRGKKQVLAWEGETCKSESSQRGGQQAYSHRDGRHIDGVEQVAVDLLPGRAIVLPDVKGQHRLPVVMDELRCRLGRGNDHKNKRIQR